MKKIDIKESLFDILLDDYESYKTNKDYQNQFQSGIDFFESVIKFFAVLNISVLKNTDEKLFKKVIADNFKDKPSLGDFKSLATHSLKSETTNELYNFLKDIFNEKTNLNNEVYSLKAIKNGTNDKVSKNNQDISTYLKLYDNYLVSFRNQLKGHSASFRAIDEKEKEFVDKVINSLDLIVESLKTQLFKTLEKVEFFVRDYKLIAKYEEIEIDLLPFILYLPCDKYSCCQDEKCENKRVRVFFFNDKDKSKIYFLDYGYNHFYNLKDLADKNFIEEMELLLQELKKYKKEINFIEYINNQAKHKNLLENFVGRKEELDLLKTHINSNLFDATFSYIVGKPGIGKSALIAKLIDELKEQKEIKSFIFYAKSGNMGDKASELESVYGKIEKFIKDVLNDNKLKIEANTINNKFDELFRYYESNSTSPILLVIDGLDEFRDWQYIVDNIPLNFSKNIHLVFTSRDYNNIISHIETKVSDYNSSLKVLKHNDNLYLKLQKLNDEEVEELINIALPKELKKHKDYKEIINIIIQKSEALPLYLDYLISGLKTKNIKLDKFKEWSEKLPIGIDKFYEEAFNKASNEAMKILTLLYFSIQNIYKRDIKVIFKKLKIVNNDKEFNQAFEEIEIFLYEVDELYSFYHQSVKDAIEIYLQNNDELMILDNEKIYETLLFKPNDKKLYLDTTGESFELIEKTISFLKDNQSLDFYTQSFFHLYYQYIFFKLYASLLSFSDVKKADYSKLLEKTEINNEIKNHILDFCQRFDEKQTKHIFEIRYAYDLSFLIKDYKKVLKYMDEYQNVLYEMFLDIAMNIDKVEYIQKFLNHKDDWINNIPEEMKKIYIQIMAKKETFPDEFVKVMEFLDYEYKVELVGKLNIKLIKNILKNLKSSDYEKIQIIKNHLNIEDSLELLKELNLNEEDYAKALLIILQKSLEINDVNRAKQILKYIPNQFFEYDFTRLIGNNNYYEYGLLEIIEKQAEIDVDESLKLLEESNLEGEIQAKALFEILKNSNNINKSLEILNKIDNKEYKHDDYYHTNYYIKGLLLVIEKQVKIDIDKAKNMLNKIENKYYCENDCQCVNPYKEGLLTILKTQAKIDINEAMKIIEQNNLDEELKARALNIILIEYLNQYKIDEAIQILNKIDDKNFDEFCQDINYYEESVLEIIKKQIEINIDEAFKTLNNFNFNETSISRILLMLLKTYTNQNDAKTAIQILNKITDEYSYKEGLLEVVKIQSSETLEIINHSLQNIKNDINSYNKTLFVNIVRNTDNKNILKQIFIILNKIYYNDKLQLLITSLLDSKREILNIINIHINFNSKTLLLIIQKHLEMDNIEKAKLILLMITNTDNYEFNGEQNPPIIINYYSEAVLEIIKLQIKININIALETLEQYNIDDEYKSKIFLIILIEYLNYNNIKKAKDFLFKIENLYKNYMDKHLFSSKIILNSYEKGVLEIIKKDSSINLKQSLNLIKIDDDELKDKVLLVLVKRYLDENQINKAIQTLKHIKAIYSEAVLEIIEKQSLLDTKKALIILKELSIKNDSIYLQGLLIILKTYLNKDNITNAKQILSKIQETKEKTYAYLNTQNNKVYYPYIEGILLFISKYQDINKIKEVIYIITNLIDNINLEDDIFILDTLLIIVNNTNDKDILREVFFLIKKIDVDNDNKVQILVTIIKKVFTLYQTDIIKIIKYIINNNYFKDKSLLQNLLYRISIFLLEIDNIELFLNIYNLIDDYKYIQDILDKVQNIAEKEIILQPTLNKIFNLNISDNEKQKLFQQIQKENLNKYNLIIQNPITQEFLVESFDISETLDIINEISYKDVLSFYGINVLEKTSKLDSFIEDTKEKLNNLDKKEQRKVIAELKNQILSDESLTNEFIEKYGDDFDIEIKDDFEELTLGNFKDVFIK